MNIRLATEEDLQSIVDIYNHEVLHSTATFDTVPATIEDRRSWLLEHSSPRHPVLVCEWDRSVTGWASLTPWSNRGAYARAAEVSVYVASDKRGSGVGTALLGALIDRARTAELGVLLARISCGEGPGSRRLHEALGFTMVGTMRRVGEKFDRVLDIDLLEYQLE